DEEIDLVVAEQAGGVAVGDLKPVLALELAPGEDGWRAFERRLHELPLQAAEAGRYRHPRVDAALGDDGALLANVDAGEVRQPAPRAAPDLVVGLAEQFDDAGAKGRRNEVPYLRVSQHP